MKQTKQALGTEQLGQNDYSNLADCFVVCPRVSLQASTKVPEFKHIVNYAQRLLSLDLHKALQG